MLVYVEFFFSWPCLYDPSPLLSFFFQTGIWFGGTETFNALPSDEKLLLCLTILVNSALDFLSWCISNGLTLKPVSIIKRINLRARPILLLKPMFSSELTIFKFLSVCIASSTAPVPVCSFGGLYSISMFFYKTLFTLHIRKLYPCLILFS